MVGMGGLLLTITFNSKRQRNLNPPTHCDGLGDRAMKAAVLGEGLFRVRWHCYVRVRTYIVSATRRCAGR